MIERPLWFPLYCLEFLMDPHVTGLDLEAQAILVRMWCLVAREHVPDDPAAVARIGNMPVARVELYWSDVRRFFQKDEDGNLYSKRLDRELEVFRAKIERHRIGAMKTNSKRWGDNYVPKTPGYVKRTIQEPESLFQAPAQAAPHAPKKTEPRSPRRKRGEVLEPFSAEIRAFVNETCERWPKADPDGRRITIGAGIFAENVESILKTYPTTTLADLSAVVDEYLDPNTTRKSYKAPQYFFGEKGPWMAMVRARLTRTEVSA